MKKLAIFVLVLTFVMGMSVTALGDFTEDSDTLNVEVEVGEEIAIDFITDDLYEELLPGEASGLDDSEVVAEVSGEEDAQFDASWTIIHGDNGLDEIFDQFDIYTNESNTDLIGDDGTAEIKNTIRAGTVDTDADTGVYSSDINLLVEYSY